MQGLTMQWPRRAEQRRKLIVLGGSAVLHIGVLGWLAASAIGVDDCCRPDLFLDAPIYIEMEPRPLLPGEVARVRPPAARERLMDTQPLAGSASAAPSNPLRNARPEDIAAPTAPAPRMVAAPPAGAPAPPANPWTVGGDRSDAAIVQSLRTSAAGCRTMEGRLTAAEQTLCDQRFGEAGARAGSPGPRTLTPAEARRESQFIRDGAAAIARYEAKRAPLGSGVGITGPADCVGSNFGTGCSGAHLDPSIRQGATTNLRQGGNRTESMRPIPGNE